MRFTDFSPLPRVRLLVAAAVAALLGGCAQNPAPPPPSARPAITPPAADGRAGGSLPPAAPGVREAPRVQLPSPAATRDWDEFKLQAARRLVAANPSGTYMGPVSEPLLAIPVLEIELARDGSVRHIRVLRHPSQALDTVQLAVAAVHRAAPFGDMSRLPQPWKFAEVFLFDDDRRFKPRTLDD